SLAVRKKRLVDAGVFPIDPGWFHDAWIACQASSKGCTGDFITEPLLLYRQHEDQLSKPLLFVSAREANQRNLHSAATVGVAMYVCNGEKHLQEQLTSIENQTRPPDKLTVCNDGSTDNTAAILAAFAHRASFPVEIIYNPKQLGWAKGIEQALLLCRTDIIAFAGQDDIWLLPKLEKLAQKLNEEQKNSYVFSDAVIVDSELTPLHTTVWEKFKFTWKNQEFFSSSSQKQVEFLKSDFFTVTIAAMAIKKVLVPQIIPINAQWYHPEAYPACAAAVQGYWGVFVKEPLILYRQPEKLTPGKPLTNLKGHLKLVGSLEAKTPVLRKH
ncbi:MAG: glycosyltransferase, partial [Sporomusaceae bacterium]|nr:glycosyltransferase [Sporomusaceae bacterium]